MLVLLVLALVGVALFLHRIRALRPGVESGLIGKVPPRESHESAATKLGAKLVQDAPAKTSTGEIARPRLDESFVEREVIPKLLARASRPHRDLPRALTRFLREEDWQLREGRLIARVFPDLLERIMIRAVNDPAMDGAQKYYAMFLLGYLVEEGRPKAAEALKQVASSSDEVLYVRALDVMAEADHTSQFRQFFMQRSSQGISEAIQPLAYLGDAGTNSFLKSMASTESDGTRKTFRLQFRAKEALSKNEILESPDWQMKLADTILKGEYYHEVSWAIEAARRNDFPHLTDLLRQRLDITIDQMSTLYSKLQKMSSIPPEQQTSFGDAYRSQPLLGNMPSYLDDALVTQLELGGKLTDLERARLRTFGYGCDPKERLRELLGAD